MDKKRYTFDIQLNSLSETDNPTRVEAEFVLHDFELSANYTIITKEAAEKALPTLQNMPIVAKYYPVSEPGAKDDALGGHEMTIGVDRETGEEIIQLNTVPIGVFTEPAYITTITDEYGNEKEVVAGKGILWASRFPNVIGLLKEWIDEGITVYSSMEILYDSYSVEEGITTIHNYIFEGHCLLNAETRGNHNKIYPAYDVSKLTKLVAQAMKQDENKQKEEGEKMSFKKVFELSHGDIRAKLYEKLDKTLGEEEFAWIVDVYDDYFIANIYSLAENNEYDKFFKFNYTKTEDDVEIDFESKVEVFLKRNWEEVIPDDVQQQLNEKDEKIEKLEKELNEIKQEKDEIEKQFNEATEKLTELNSIVKELESYKEKYEKEQFEKALAEKKEYYSDKFFALNAMDKYNSKEVQELIIKSVKDDEEGREAILQLNSMLVDLVKVDKKNKGVIRETASKREDLLPDEDSFDARYGL